MIKPFNLIRKKELLLCVLLTSGITYVYSVDYCTLECDDQPHTMCQYPTDGPSEKCSGYQEQLISDKDKTMILGMHNKFRNKVAGGNEKRGNPGPQPSAANMMELGWDAEIAKIAQRWAYQCTFAHDKCRKTKGSSVSQNIGIEKFSDQYRSHYDFLITSWYEEVINMEPDVVTDFRSTGEMIGHYTQLVYANTRYVGCGHVYYNDEGEIKYASLLVCNYKPAGNVLGQPLYQIGNPASNCPDGSRRSETWKNLCTTSGSKCGTTLASNLPFIVIILPVVFIFSTLKL